MISLIISRVRDERIIMAQGRVIGRGLVVTCGLLLLLLSAARRSEGACHVQLDFLNSLIDVKIGGEVIALLARAPIQLGSISRTS